MAVLDALIGFALGVLVGIVANDITNKEADTKIDFIYQYLVRKQLAEENENTMTDQQDESSKEEGS